MIGKVSDDARESMMRDLADAQQALRDAGFPWPETTPAEAIRSLDDRLTASATFGHETVAKLLALLAETGRPLASLPSDLRERLERLTAIRNGSVAAAEEAEGGK